MLIFSELPALCSILAFRLLGGHGPDDHANPLLEGALLQHRRLAEHPLLPPGLSYELINRGHTVFLGNNRPTMDGLGRPSYDFQPGSRAEFRESISLSV